jgi:hypothetical protein
MIYIQLPSANFLFSSHSINRDPRWGRNQEVPGWHKNYRIEFETNNLFSPGEDPYLTSQYVMNFVRGLQEGNDFRYAKVISKFDRILTLSDLSAIYVHLHFTQFFFLGIYC